MNPAVRGGPERPVIKFTPNFLASQCQAGDFTLCTAGLGSGRKIDGPGLERTSAPDPDTGFP